MIRTDILDILGPNEIIRARRVFRHATCLNDAARELRMCRRTARYLAERLQMPLGLNADIMASHRAATNDLNMKGWRESDDQAERIVARIEGRLPLRVRQQAVRKAAMYGMAAILERVRVEAEFAAIAAQERRAKRASHLKALAVHARQSPDRAIAAIVDLACDFHAVSLEDVAGKAHSHHLVHVRVAVAHACRDVIGRKASKPKIGRALGRDHSTIFHALQKPIEPHAEFIEHVREVLG